MYVPNCLLNSPICFSKAASNPPMFPSLLNKTTICQVRKLTSFNFFLSLSPRSISLPVLSTVPLKKKKRKVTHIPCILLFSKA